MAKYMSESASTLIMPLRYTEFTVFFYIKLLCQNYGVAVAVGVGSRGTGRERCHWQQLERWFPGSHWPWPYKWSPWLDGSYHLWQTRGGSSGNITLQLLCTWATFLIVLYYYLSKASTMGNVKAWSSNNKSEVCKLVSMYICAYLHWLVKCFTMCNYASDRECEDILRTRAIYSTFARANTGHRFIHVVSIVFVLAKLSVDVITDLEVSGDVSHLYRMGDTQPGVGRRHCCPQLLPTRLRRLHIRKRSDIRNFHHWRYWYRLLGSELKRISITARTSFIFNFCQFLQK